MYDFDKPVTRTGTNCIKWDMAGGRFGTDRELIPMWIADTDFRSPPEVVRALTGRAEHGIFGYTYASDEYYAAVSAWYKGRHGVELCREQIHPTIGVVPSLYFAIKALTKPGDGVLVLSPAYDPFYSIIEKSSRRLVTLELELQRSVYGINFDAMEKAFKDGVRMLIFCNPHNPVGRVWTREEMEAVASLCARYGVYLASDEIHADFGMFGNRCTCAMNTGADEELTFVCSSAGKTFNIAGLQASYILCRGKRLMKKIKDELSAAFIMEPNIFGLAATAAAYSQGAPWLDGQLEYIEANSVFARSYLERRLPAVSAARHEGTYLLWLDFSGLGLAQDEFRRRLVHDCGIGLGDGLQYGGQCGQFMRMNIGCTRKTLEKAMESMARNLA